MRGIFWAGDGTEVQRDDEDRIYPGDMEAAVALARGSDSHWLVYLPRRHDDPWAVLAFADRGAAEECAADADGAFAWDGRLGAPPVHESGVAFTRHPEAL